MILKAEGELNEMREQKSLVSIKLIEWISMGYAYSTNQEFNVHISVLELYQLATNLCLFYTNISMFVNARWFL